MANKVFQIQDLNQLEQVAQYLTEQFLNYKLFFFDGDLGAGKTTLIQFILKKLNYQLKVNSPTFSKVHEYKTHNFLIYHLDLYRDLPNLAEFEEILLQPNSLVFIEWANQLSENYLELIKTNFLQIQLSCKANEERIIKIVSSLA